MSANVCTTVYNWLRELRIPISKTYFRQQLKTHPEYPSLLSITDTLDELGIANTAIKIEKEQLHEIPTPFIAHLEHDFGEFVTIKNRDKLDKQFPGFFDRWDGVVLIGEKPDPWRHVENSEWIRKEKMKEKAALLTLSILALFIILSIRISFSWVYIVLAFVAVTGVFISWLIASKDIGIENKMAEQLCGKDADCDSVIHSGKERPAIGIGWSDAGIIYFPFLAIALMIVSFGGTTGNSYQFFSILACGSIPVTIVSIYYQWRVVRKWCRLCLIMVSLLWIQFFVLLPETLSMFRSGFDKINFRDASLLTLLLFISAAAWLWLKPLLKQNIGSREDGFAKRRLESNADIFKVLLQRERKIDTTSFENDLQLGNPDAGFQIMVACNPYCGPCAKAHKILHELVEQNDIGLTIRFIIKNNKSDPKRVAVKHILQVVNRRSIEYKRKVLKDWYESMNLKLFKELHPVNEDSAMELIEETSGPLNGIPSSDEYTGLLFHERWTRESNVASTPTIFINGHELPNRYDANDLKMIAKGFTNNNDLIDIERKKVFDFV